VPKVEKDFKLKESKTPNVKKRGTKANGTKQSPENLEETLRSKEANVNMIPAMADKAKIKKSLNSKSNKGSMVGSFAVGGKKGNDSELSIENDRLKTTLMVLN